MKHTRHIYHYAMRAAKRADSLMRRHRLAEACDNSNDKDMWKELKLMNPRQKVVSRVVDDAATGTDIANVFGRKYESVYNSSPTSADNMNNVREIVNERIQVENHTECLLELPGVVEAVRTLRKGKHDDSLRFFSDHIIHGSLKLLAMLVMLINSIFIHGYSPDELLNSIVIPIPKNNRVSLKCSDNYRGIALCNCICKLIDILLISRYSHVLQTSNLQFGFKENHHSVLCSTVFMETVSYFTTRHTDVYACLLDASKAFYRANFGKLFMLLLERNMPSLIVRYLMDSYTRQSVIVQWDGCRSTSFRAQNGVKQGGVLSPMLFALYIDVLLLQLGTSGLGCYIANVFLGALGYADDSVIMSPSSRGLNEMIRVCESYADEYSLLFNEQKTVAIKFGDNFKSNCHVLLNGKQVEWKEEVRHLGNIISSTLSDAPDCALKRSQFISFVNKMIGNYRNVHTDILCRLFCTYCCSFYGSELWGCNSTGFSRIVTEWHKAYRRVIQLPYCTHRWLLGPLSGQRNILE